MLSRDGNIISAKVDILYCLAEAFAKVSDSSSCSNLISLKRGKRSALILEGANTEPYIELSTSTTKLLY